MSDKHISDAAPQQPAATSETVNVIGMPEFDGLLDYIYEHGTAAEGVVEKANAFARAVIARYAPQQPAAVDAERWRYIRRKLCLTGNGDGTCAMQAINLPANIQGWPEPGQVAEFCDAAIDAALAMENSND